ncbi:allantoate deiminase [Halalkalibacter hemicellulosilyticus]|uniref:Allantoate amidohydrolase n=1 Tax=Halalkalibacter hemicellulosilyticusJCM 9152 TaxID=1236971 RepID=W4QK89_9BACI|nr:allantoate deiminase [Halalkalibacter hemicellulosilyticus]GAE32053.1 allantoate amidohydrolase [Halalkalibacter hemicellulosilyticusJCM 9152]
MLAYNEEVIDVSDNINDRLKWLASFGERKDVGITRLLYTDSWLKAQQALATWMKQLGLNVYYDDVGNLFGRLEGKNPLAKPILTGSHIDTVKHGGMYDGSYGIVAGILALKTLMEREGEPERSVEVVSICEEEGSRFPFTYWGSKNIVGETIKEDVSELRDEEGISLLEAKNRLGFTSKLTTRKKKDVSAFIELHVEQGIILEREKLDIGIVEAIVGQRRFNVRLHGEANHAGTTPMKYRRDAVRGAGKLIDHLMEMADDYGEPLVATVGKIEVLPNTPNVIPGEVSFTIDVRHPEVEVLEAFCDHFYNEFYTISKRCNLQIEITRWMESEPVKMAPELNEKILEVCLHKNIKYKKMISGAGHDAQVFSKYYPATLLFVPSQQGVSHSPLEYTDERNLQIGINVLTETLYKLAYKGERT